MRRLAYFSSVLAVLLGGCGDGFFDDYGPDEDHCAPPPPTPTPVRGAELGLGRFTWGCIGNSDPTCDRGEFPPAVALGSDFDLSFSESIDLPSEILFSGIEPVSDLVTESSAGFVANTAGEVTLVAMATDAVIDFCDLEIMPVDRFSLSLMREPDPEDEEHCPGTRSPEAVGARVEVAVGESPTLHAMPYAGSRWLGGTLDYDWESLTPSIAAVTRLDGRSARVDAFTHGIAQIVVSAGGHQEVIEVEVGPAVSPSGDEVDDEGPQRTRPEDEQTGTGGSDDAGSDDGGSGDEGSGDADLDDWVESATGTSGGM